MGYEPERFVFRGNVAAVAGARPNLVQQLVDTFKSWLPKATERLRMELEAKAKEDHERHLEAVERERGAQEERLRVLGELRF